MSKISIFFVFLCSERNDKKWYNTRVDKLMEKLKNRKVLLCIAGILAVIVFVVILVMNLNKPSPDGPTVFTVSGPGFDGGQEDGTPVSQGQPDVPDHIVSDVSGDSDMDNTDDVSGNTVTDNVNDVSVNGDDPNAPDPAPDPDPAPNPDPDPAPEP